MILQLCCFISIPIPIPENLNMNSVIFGVFINVGTWWNHFPFYLQSYFSITGSFFSNSSLDLHYLLYLWSFGLIIFAQPKRFWSDGSSKGERPTDWDTLPYFGWNFGIYFGQLSVNHSLLKLSRKYRGKYCSQKTSWKITVPSLYS